LGVLTKAALAYVALKRLAKPPVRAIEHALSVLVDDTDLEAWNEDYCALWASVVVLSALPPPHQC
jgi:hypothetical protein